MLAATVRAEGEADIAAIISCDMIGGRAFTDLPKPRCTDELSEGAMLHWIGPRRKDRALLFLHGTLFPHSYLDQG
jgi:hypothetical protein